MAGGRLSVMALIDSDDMVVEGVRLRMEMDGVSLVEEGKFGFLALVPGDKAEH